MKNKKIQLAHLKVSSFVTDQKSNQLIKGGETLNDCTNGTCQYRTWLIGPCAPNSSN